MKLAKQILLVLALVSAIPAYAKENSIGTTLSHCGTVANGAKTTSSTTVTSEDTTPAKNPLAGAALPGAGFTSIVNGTTPTADPP